ncbi:SRPBCC family protein [Pigmentiphaga soli]|uniref:SRPBCC family protein n=1 Tax=Pigmentiphaga soli TaxID=1007095 RepID=A0ABP8GXR6_9BURK
MLKFEHLVQINDPQLPALEPLSREQLWRGLVMRARFPTEFVLGLESCVIESEREAGDDTVLTRKLDFGPFQVHDTVTLTPMDRVSVVAQATDLWPRSEATVHIEEPQPGALFLRFVYELALEDGSEDLAEPMQDLRKQAYVAADLDTVQRIRELTGGSGLLH